MGKIVILDENSSNKIAAGEVIEKPASVVKELVENSIDAGAQTITVELKNGGIKLIRVTDNGSGIDEDDVELAFERHATSKIRHADDLESISTLGFRGEALASIAAVSSVEVKTRVEGKTHGTYIRIEGGVVKEIGQTGCPVGTSFTVRELFYNTPARYKFLKKDSTEAGYISDVISRIALARPDISFRLINSGATVLHTPGNNDLLSVIYSVYGKSIADNLIKFEGTDGPFSIYGYAGKPEISRANRNHQTFFINGRYIKSRIISAAVEEAYKTFLMKGKFPFIVLNISVNPMLIDVNVHPTKMEVKFADEQQVFRSVYHAVYDSLIQRRSIRSIHLEQKAANPYLRDDGSKPGEYRQEMLQEPLVFVRESRASLLSRNLKPADEGNGFSAPSEQTGNETADSILSKEQQRNNEPANYVQSNNVHSNNVQSNNVQLNYEQSYHKDAGPLQTKTEHLKSEMTGEFSKPEEKASKQIITEKAEIESVDTGISNAHISEQTFGQIAGQSTNQAAGHMVGQSTDQAPAQKVEQTIGQAPAQKAGQTIDRTTGHTVGQSTYQAKGQTFVDNKNLREAVYIGQAFSTYIILQLGDELLLMDQHAAHERVMYEGLLQKYKNSEPIAQFLLVPVVIELSPAELKLVETEKNFLDSIGFNCEYFGNNSVILRSIPSGSDGQDSEQLFRDVIDSFSSAGKGNYEKAAEEALYTVACKAAVKANKKLDAAEVKSLIEQLALMENPYTCPHGRPTVIRLSKYELEKMFKRIV